MRRNDTRPSREAHRSASALPVGLDATNRVATHPAIPGRLRLFDQDIAQVQCLAWLDGELLANLDTFVNLADGSSGR